MLFHVSVISPPEDNVYYLLDQCSRSNIFKNPNPDPRPKKPNKITIRIHKTVLDLHLLDSIHKYIARQSRATPNNILPYIITVCRGGPASILHNCTFIPIENSTKRLTYVLLYNYCRGGPVSVQRHLCPARGEVSRQVRLVRSAQQVQLYYCIFFLQNFERPPPSTIIFSRLHIYHIKRS